MIATQCRETISANCGRTGKSDSDVEGETYMTAQVFGFAIRKIDMVNIVLHSAL